MAGYRYYSIVPDSAVARVLMVRSSDGWTLPHFDLDRAVIWQAVDHVNRDMREMRWVGGLAPDCRWAGPGLSLFWHWGL